MRAVVVGSGIGGLTAAIRLAAAGHDVSVLERNPVVGGRVAELSETGYHFELGPTSLLVPRAFDDVLGLAGTSLADHVDLVRLDPQVRYHWRDGSTLDVRDDPDATTVAIERFSAGAGAQWSSFVDHVGRAWSDRERSMLGDPSDGTKAARNRADSRRTVADAAAAFVDDPRLRQLVGHSVAALGSSPYQTPATALHLAHVEQATGAWYVRGGTARVVDALARALTTMGVDIRTNADVGRIATDAGSVTGVDLADGGHEPADVVVANVDAAHLYTDLLPHPKQARRLDRAGPSYSAFVMCAAVRGRTEGIAHHNVFFSLHDQQEFRYLSAGQIPIDQTISASVSAVTDPGQAPPDCENWRVTVATPPAIGIDKKLMTAGVLNRLAERGFDLRSRVEFTRTFVPADFDARYRNPGGSLYGVSSNGKRAASLRPDNVGPVDGLYLVGGSTRPAGGPAFAATSARIVADLVAARHG